VFYIQLMFVCLLKISPQLAIKGKTGKLSQLVISICEVSISRVDDFRLSVNQT